MVVCFYVTNWRRLAQQGRTDVIKRVRRALSLIPWLVKSRCFVIAPLIVCSTDWLHCSTCGLRNLETEENQENEANLTESLAENKSGARQTE